MKSKQQMIFEEMCYQLMKVITAPEHEYIDDKGVDDSEEVNEVNVRLVMSSLTTTLVKCALVYGVPLENILANVEVGYEVFGKEMTNE
jgi:hypothetical protein